MCHLGQRQAAASRFFAPQGECHYRHVVYAFGLDDGLRHTERGRQPVGVRVNDIIQFDQRRDVLLAHLELHGEYRHARL